MLDELSVENLGLIPSARIDPGPGLVVITGETGTGKTLLLGALRLLRGEQARKDQIVRAPRSMERWQPLGIWRKRLAACSMLSDNTIEHCSASREPFDASSTVP